MEGILPTRGKNSTIPPRPQKTPNHPTPEKLLPRFMCLHGNVYFLDTSCGGGGASPLEGNIPPKTPPTSGRRGPRRATGSRASWETRGSSDTHRPRRKPQPATPPRQRAGASEGCGQGCGQGRGLGQAGKWAQMKARGGEGCRRGCGQRQAGLWSGAGRDWGRGGRGGGSDWLGLGKGRAEMGMEQAGCGQG